MAGKGSRNRLKGSALSKYEKSPLWKKKKAEAIKLEAQQTKEDNKKCH